jgi:hypothetical protein
MTGAGWGTDDGGLTTDDGADFGSAAQALQTIASTTAPHTAYRWADFMFLHSPIPPFISFSGK